MMSRLRRSPVTAVSAIMALAMVLANMTLAISIVGCGDSSPTYRYDSRTDPRVSTPPPPPPPVTQGQSAGSTGVAPGTVAPGTGTSSSGLDYQTQQKMDELTSRINTWLFLRNSYSSRWGDYWTMSSYMQMTSSFSELDMLLAARAGDPTAYQARAQLATMRQSFDTWRMVQMMRPDISESNAMMMIPFLEAQMRLKALCGGTASINYFGLPGSWGITYYDDLNPYYLSYGRRFSYTGTGNGNTYPGSSYDNGYGYGYGRDPDYPTYGPYYGGSSSTSGGGSSWPYAGSSGSTSGSTSSGSTSSGSTSSGSTSSGSTSSGTGGSPGWDDVGRSNTGTGR